MKLIDLNDDRVYTPADLKRDWAQFREEDPDNHAASFRIEFFEILMATINGRNDLEITDQRSERPRDHRPDPTGNQQPHPSPAGTALKSRRT